MGCEAETLLRTRGAVLGVARHCGAGASVPKLHLVHGMKSLRLRAGAVREVGKLDL